MKIAVVGPSPIPFTLGGMENMLSGLYNTINHKTNHQAELIKVPAREHSFWELIDSYYQFYKLDLRHFDLVIASKYPAWMVQHDNCILYVAHRLRGLYDTYHLTKLPLQVKPGNPKIDKILTYMEENPHPANLDTFFTMMFALREQASATEEPYFSFPGPFIRKLVHYMDDFGFRSHENVWYSAISKTVRDRAGYFPEKAEVNVIYLPAAQEQFTTGEYRHIFMISRLDAPKRIDMLVKAMKYVKSDVALYIAGTGPEKEKLEKLADGDKRIHFLGFVSDEEAERYYANSLVIPYFPYEEDYGLITIEAMMHKKPVITTVDAGGPTEFVANGETGYVVELKPQQIAEKIDHLVRHPEEAARMGHNGYDLVKDISWERVVDSLLDPVIHAPKRRRITVTSTFSVYPPQGGGQARIFHLYRELAKRFDVEIVSYTNCDQPAFYGKIAEHLWERRVPKELRHQQKEWEMEKAAKIPLSDIAEITLGGETAAYCTALEQSLKKSDLCVISHPYLYPVAKKYLGSVPFVYEAHNLESVMKKNMLPESRIKDKLVQQVYDTEKECCEKAVLIMTCSEEDRQKIHTLYEVPAEKIVVVPNGVDTQATRFVSVEERRHNKKLLDLQDEKIGVFMGSWHGPNLEACEKIFELAPLCPDVKFMLMGSQCNYFKDRALPANVAMLGLVGEEAKNRVFSTVDFALNPMLSGSGTNLKMFDYMSAGIPIITTTFGTRGIENKELFFLADSKEEAAQKIRDFQLNEKMGERVLRMREYVKETFDWSVIAQIAARKMEEL